MKRLLFLFAFVPCAYAQSGNPTVDFPQGKDWTFLTRPSGAVIAGASHVDNDEVELPLAGQSANGKIAKTVKATGQVDSLAYAGPVMTSTLTNFDALLKEAVAAGFKPIFTCVRKQCGGFTYLQHLFMPLVNSLSGTDYYNFTQQALAAWTDDVRSTTMQRGTGEYLTLTTALARTLTPVCC